MMSERTDPAELEESTRRWIYAGLILLGLFIAVFPIYRWYEPAQRAEAREDQLSFLAAQGGELFEGECSSCHGVEGRGGIAPAVGSRNFLESVDDSQIEQLVAVGIPGTEMVSYSIDYGGPMTSEEIDALTVYLRSLEEDSESNQFWQTPLAAEDLFGQDLYTMACSRCHGIDRTGIEDVAPDLSETSFALEESDEWLTGRITDGFKEMPRFGRVLTEEQVAIIISFLRGTNTNTTTTTTTTTTSPPATAAPGTPTTTAPPGTPTTTEPPAGVDPEILALGQDVYEFTGRPEPCAKCHGTDAQGTSDGPGILGSSKSAISGAMGGGIVDMEELKLSRDELTAVYEWLRHLTDLQRQQ
jgi:mono/diheme cytochrome c family protein